MQALISFLQAHSVVLAALGVAVMDFIVEMIPSIKSNSLVSLVLSALQKLAGGSAPQA